MTRYYLISAIAVLGLTVLISVLRQTRTRKEFFMIMISVAGGLVLLIGVLVGISQGLVWLGIAKSGFI